ALGEPVRLTRSVGAAGGPEPPGQPLAPTARGPGGGGAVRRRPPDPGGAHPPGPPRHTFPRRPAARPPPPGTPRGPASLPRLRYLADCTVDQIAAELGCPAGSVKVWLSRGRAALAAAIGADDQDLPMRDDDRGGRGHGPEPAAARTPDVTRAPRTRTEPHHD